MATKKVKKPKKPSIFSPGFKLDHATRANTAFLGDGTKKKKKTPKPKSKVNTAGKKPTKRK